ncbi:rubredoxin [Novosphingobium bradum]|uniref:Rubredoxin n=1 Tax=Novosphingobium bradum TaxID=1737444 RepID=A0ABV7INZ5_9SPHN
MSEAKGRHACTYCGYVYDEAAGCPEEGVPPGTPWAAVPDDWSCPMCGAEKDGFVPEE